MKKKMDQLENCPQFAHKLFWLVCNWLVLVGSIFYGMWTNLLVRCQSGQKLVTDVWHVWPRTFITQVNLGNIVMWVAQHNSAEQDYFGILTLQETWKTQNQHQADFLCILEVKHSYQKDGCARNRPRSHTAQKQLSEYLLMQVHAWTEFSRLIFGIWLLKSFTLLQLNQRKPKIKHEETRCATPHQTSTPPSRPPPLQKKRRKVRDREPQLDEQRGREGRQGEDEWRWPLYWCLPLVRTPGSLAISMQMTRPVLGTGPSVSSWNAQLWGRRGGGHSRQRHSGEYGGEARRVANILFTGESDRSTCERGPGGSWRRRGARIAESRTAGWQWLGSLVEHEEEDRQTRAQEHSKQMDPV